jgi:hypothetical protein
MCVWNMQENILSIIEQLSNTTHLILKRARNRQSQVVR